MCLCFKEFFLFEQNRGAIWHKMGLDGKNHVSILVICGPFFSFIDRSVNLGEQERSLRKIDFSQHVAFSVLNHLRFVAEIENWSRLQQFWKFFTSVRDSSFLLLLLFIASIGSTFGTPHGVGTHSSIQVAFLKLFILAVGKSIHLKFQFQSNKSQFSSCKNCFVPLLDCKALEIDKNYTKCKGDFISKQIKRKRRVVETVQSEFDYYYHCCPLVVISFHFSFRVDESVVSWVLFPLVARHTVSLQFSCHNVEWQKPQYRS